MSYQKSRLTSINTNVRNKLIQTFGILFFSFDSWNDIIDRARFCICFINNNDTESGSGIFLIGGVGIQDAAALDITVSYELAILSNPRFVEGPLIPGAMTAFNPNIPEGSGFQLFVHNP